MRTDMPGKREKIEDGEEFYCGNCGESGPSLIEGRRQFMAGADGTCLCLDCRAVQLRERMKTGGSIGLQANTDARETLVDVSDWGRRMVFPVREAMTAYTKKGRAVIVFKFTVDEDDWHGSWYLPRGGKPSRYDNWAQCRRGTPRSYELPVSALFERPPVEVTLSEASGQFVYRFADGRTAALNDWVRWTQYKALKEAEAK